jgi:hypothetical protein
MPLYNGGSPLLGYRITIKAHNGSYIEDVQDCDGSDQTTRANMFCIISMEKLRTKYNLV